MATTNQKRLIVSRLTGFLAVMAASLAFSGIISQYIKEEFVWEYVLQIWFAAFFPPIAGLVALFTGLFTFPLWLWAVVMFLWLLQIYHTT